MSDGDDNQAQLDLFGEPTAPPKAEWLYVTVNLPGHLLHGKRCLLMGRDEHVAFVSHPSLPEWIGFHPSHLR